MGAAGAKTPVHGLWDVELTQGKQAWKGGWPSVLGAWLKEADGRDTQWNGQSQFTVLRRKPSLGAVHMARFPPESSR